MLVQGYVNIRNWMDAMIGISNTLFISDSV